MNAFIVFLHFLGLMLGAAGGFASGIIMRRAQSAAPEQAMTLRSLGPTLANVSATGLVLLWVTGLILVFSKWGGFGALPALFWWKLLFVVVLTVLIGLIHMTYAQIRRTKNPALGARLAMIGPAAGATTLIIVLLAAYTFTS